MEIPRVTRLRYYDTEREMNKYGKIRAIVIESGDQKKRSVVYSNDKDRSAGEIIQLICMRWGQENLIKTLKLRHLIDYHPGYFSEELEEQPLVTNPQREEMKQQKATLVSQLHKLELKFAEKIIDEAKAETHWREIQQSEMEILGDIATIKSKITLMTQEMDKLPKEVKFDKAFGDKLLELDYEKKRFLDCIKVFACHMENKMCEILLNYYDNQKEILPLLHMIVNRGAHVRLTEGKLVVRLRKFKNPEVNYAARHLCNDLNQTNPVTLDRFQFPIRYEVI